MKIKDKLHQIPVMEEIISLTPSIISKRIDKLITFAKERKIHNMDTDFMKIKKKFNWI